MSYEELIVVHGTIHVKKENTTYELQPTPTVASVSTINLGKLKISFYNGVDKHIIQNII